MNEILVYEPRWHDRKVLVRSWGLRSKNRIRLTKAPQYQPLVLTDAEIRDYPLVMINGKRFRAVPLERFTKQNPNQTQLLEV